MRCLIKGVNLKRIATRLLLLVLAVAGMLQLSSCGNGEGTGVYSAITKKCTLNTPFEGKDFINDGIAEAKLTKATDGDTAQFQTVGEQGYGVVIRFFCIDTPESTGSVEKWGKSASKFTAETLENAYSIVLEASTTPASKDSYGTRYLAYVWYKNSENDTYKNLNLQIVENGYSDSKASNTSEYKYYSYFAKAKKFAKEKALHMWGDEEDPYYSTEAIETNIKDITENKDTYYSDDTQTGSKVRITAYIKELHIGGSTSSPTYTFKFAQIIDGVEYSMDVYAGYATSSIAAYLKIGNMYTLTGSVAKHNGTIQISGLTYVAFQTGGDYTYQVQKNYYCTFSSTKEYISYYGTSLYSEASVTAGEFKDGNIQLSISAINKKTETKETYTLIVPNTANIDNTELNQIIGRTIEFIGYQKETGIISVSSYSSITIR